MKKLENMTKKELDEYGETLGLKLDRRKKKQDLIDIIQNEELEQRYQEAKTTNELSRRLKSEFIVETTIFVIIAIGTIFAIVN